MQLIEVGEKFEIYSMRSYLWKILPILTSHEKQTNKKIRLAQCVAQLDQAQIYLLIAGMALESSSWGSTEGHEPALGCCPRHLGPAPLLLGSHTCACQAQGRGCAQSLQEQSLGGRRLNCVKKSPPRAFDTRQPKTVSAMRPLVGLPKSKTW